MLFSDRGSGLWCIGATLFVLPLPSTCFLIEDFFFDAHLIYEKILQSIALALPPTCFPIEDFFDAHLMLIVSKQCNDTYSSEVRLSELCSSTESKNKLSTEISRQLHTMHTIVQCTVQITLIIRTWLTGEAPQLSLDLYYVWCLQISTLKLSVHKCKRTPLYT